MNRQLGILDASVPTAAVVTDYRLPLMDQPAWVEKDGDFINNGHYIVEFLDPVIEMYAFLTYIAFEMNREGSDECYRLWGVERFKILEPRDIIRLRFEGVFS